MAISFVLPLLLSLLLLVLVVVRVDVLNFERSLNWFELARGFLNHVA